MHPLRQLVLLFLSYIVFKECHNLNTMDVNGFSSQDSLKRYLFKKKIKQKVRRKMSHEILTSVSVSAHILNIFLLASFKKCLEV